MIRGERMGSYILKAQLQMQSTGALFCMFLWSNNQLLLKILFRVKENFKKKVDSDSNSKAAWPRLSSKWYLFLRLSLEFVRKFLNFVGKHPSFYPKDVC